MREMETFGTHQPEVTYRERHGSYGVALKGDMVLIELARLGHFLPGGGIEVGESIEEALVREFREETGYELTGFTHLGSAVEYVDIADKGFHMKKVGHFYLVELGAKGEPTYDDGHVYPVEWMSVAAAREKMYLESQWWAIERALAAHRPS